MDMTFWARKYEEPTNMDVSDINKAFLYEQGKVAKDFFNDEERLILACILLQGTYCPHDEEELMTCLRIVTRYNSEIAADSLMYRQPDGTVKCYRYDYKTFAKAVPLYWAMKAVTKIYNRIGYELDDKARLDKDKESFQILQDASLYGYALATLANEAKDSVALASMDTASGWKDCDFIIASFVNNWSFFKKLYCQGVDFFEFMASVGTKIPSFSSLHFTERTPYMKHLIERVRDTSRGRKYNTVNEEILVMRATHGELFTPEKK